MNEHQPPKPVIVATLFTAETVKIGIGAAAALGCAVRDTLALEDMRDIVVAYATDMKAVFIDMIGVISAIDHPKDVSSKAPARVQIERLKAIGFKYGKAYKEGRLPRAAVERLTPGVCMGLMTDIDARWRAALRLAEDGMPDPDQQLLLASKLREMFSMSAEFIGDSLYDNLTAEPNLKRLPHVRRMESGWMTRVAAGADPVQAYEDLAHEGEAMESAMKGAMDGMLGNLLRNAKKRNKDGE